MTPTEQGIMNAIVLALVKHARYDKASAAMIAGDFAEELRSRFGGYGMQNAFFSLYEKAQKALEPKG